MRKEKEREREGRDQRERVTMRTTYMYLIELFPSHIKVCISFKACLIKTEADNTM